MLLSLLLACSIGSSPEPDPASPSAQLAQQAATIADDARRVEELATAIESETDEVRRKVAAGELTQAEGVEQLRTLTSELEAAHTALQTKLSALEEDTRAASGMAAPEVIEKRR